MKTPYSLSKKIEFNITQKDKICQWYENKKARYEIHIGL